jgi:metallophosphoesterase superfamily enzyme
MQVHNHWLLTPHRAAVHLPSATAVIADLHLGYDRVRCRAGESVPACGADECLAELEALTARRPIRRLVIAGDLIEGAAGAGMAGELLGWLQDRGIELAGIVPGNHDRGLEKAGTALPLCPAGVALGGWRVLHGDGPLPPGRAVHGHFHPAVRWQGWILPCFLIGPGRLVLPAFSADAAGVQVLGDPRWRGYRCAAIAEGKVIDLGLLATVRRPRRQRKKA